MIVLQEAQRAMFYAPFYAALAKRAYEREGVEVRFVSSPTSGQALAGLMDGSVDVGWGGPMRVNEGYQTIPGADFRCFAEVVTRDPFFLLTRDARPAYSPAALMDLRLATVSEVPTPWLCLQQDVRDAGLDPAAIRRRSDATMADNMAALLRGDVDVVQVFEPYAEMMVEQGCTLWSAAATRGPCSYTTLYARAPVLAEKADEARALVRALLRTQRWVAVVEPQLLAETITPFFPDQPVSRIAAVCRRYKDLGVWGHDPILPRAGYDRLRTSMVSAGFVSPGTPFELAVDNSLAEAAVAANLPPLT